MSEVKRYRNTVRHFTDDFGDFIEVCKPGESGDYVAASAYDALKARSEAQREAQREALRKVGVILADQLVVHRLDEARAIINAALSHTKEQL